MSAVVCVRSAEDVPASLDGVVMSGVVGVVTVVDGVEVEVVVVVECAASALGAEVVVDGADDVVVVVVVVVVDGAVADFAAVDVTIASSGRSVADVVDGASTSVAVAGGGTTTDRAAIAVGAATFGAMTEVIAATMARTVFWTTAVTAAAIWEKNRCTAWVTTATRFGPGAYCGCAAMKSAITCAAGFGVPSARYSPNESSSEPVYCGLSCIV